MNSSHIPSDRYANSVHVESGTATLYDVFWKGDDCDWHWCPRLIVPQGIWHLAREVEGTYLRKKKQHGGEEWTELELDKTTQYK